MDVRGRLVQGKKLRGNHVFSAWHAQFLVRDSKAYRTAVAGHRLEIAGAAVAALGVVVMLGGVVPFLINPLGGHFPDQRPPIPQGATFGLMTGGTVVLYLGAALLWVGGYQRMGAVYQHNQALFARVLGKGKRFAARQRSPVIRPRTPARPLAASSAVRLLSLE